MGGWYAHPTAPSASLRRCGRHLLGALDQAVDVLADPRIREELTALSNWPTIPQVFVAGELVGGADIVQELALTAQLEATLEEKLGESWRRPGDERTVSVTDGPGLRLVPGV